MSQLALAFDPAAEATTPSPTPFPETPEPWTAWDLFDHETGAAIRSIFDCIEWGHEAIDAARARHPGVRGFGRAFLCLQPRMEFFGGKPEHVYRSHTDELLDRIAARGPDADLTPGTAVESVLALAHLSHAAPLRHEFYMAYAIRFLEAFGEEQASTVMGEELIRRAREDRDKPRIAEILAELAHQVRDEDRGRTWKERNQ